MKKWHIVAIIVILFSLAVRGVYIRVNGANDEKQWYVQNLGLHFSANVDSLWTFSKVNGLVCFSVTDGEFSLSTEERMNQKLKKNRSIRFVLKMHNNKLTFHSRDLDKYQVGDSIVINTDNDKIIIYRDGKLSSESAVSLALSGRVF